MGLKVGVLLTRGTKHTTKIHTIRGTINVNFSIVYFLELPDSKFRTTVKVQDKIIQYEAKEGDYLFSCIFIT